MSSPTFPTAPSIPVCSPGACDLSSRSQNKYWSARQGKGSQTLVRGWASELCGGGQQTLLMGRTRWNASFQASLQKLTAKHTCLPSVTSVQPVWPLHPSLWACLSPSGAHLSQSFLPAAATCCPILVLKFTAHSDPQTVFVFCFAHLFCLLDSTYK